MDNAGNFTPEEILEKFAEQNEYLRKMAKGTVSTPYFYVQRYFLLMGARAMCELRFGKEAASKDFPPYFMLMSSLVCLQKLGINIKNGLDILNVPEPDSPLHEHYLSLVQKGEWHDEVPDFDKAREHFAKMEG